jgi:hypothetical protein
MRVGYVIIALVTVLAGVSGIHANVAGSDSFGVSLKPGHLAPAASPDGRSTRSQPMAREDNIRLAQSKTNTLGWQDTTGSPSVAPFKWAGLLKNATSTKNGPNGWDCTAQFIKQNILLTAGHCLVDLTSGLPLAPIDPSKITFLLQYQDGSASQTFKAVCAATNPLWNLPPNYNSMSASDQSAARNEAGEHDFGMVLVDGTSSTGVMDYALDWKGKFTSAARVGYPGDILNADIIQYAPGIVFFANQIPLPKGLNLPNDVVQWGPVTNATHGMSGGAWVARMNDEEGPDKNILIAVTSSAPQLRNTDIPLFPGGTWAAYLTAAEFNPVLTLVANGCK